MLLAPRTRFGRRDFQLQKFKELSAKKGKRWQLFCFLCACNWLNSSKKPPDGALIPRAPDKHVRSTALTPAPSSLHEPTPANTLPPQQDNVRRRTRLPAWCRCAFLCRSQTLCAPKISCSRMQKGMFLNAESVHRKNKSLLTHWLMSIKCKS